MRDNLDQAEELGVDFVELPLFTMDVIAGGRVLKTQMSRVHDALKARSVEYTVHGPIGVNFMETPEIVERHLTVAKASVEAAGEIGARHIVFHSGKTSAGTEAADLEALYARQREAFATLGDLAAQHGLIVAVENIFAQGSKERASLPSRLAREIEAIGHANVRGCLDFSHAALLCSAEGVDFLTEAKAFARVCRHLHLHDSFGDPAQLWTFSRSERLAYGLGDLHLPIGWGNIPWVKIMEAFTFEPDAIFNLELPVQYWFALEDSVRAVREMAALYSART